MQTLTRPTMTRLGTVAAGDVGERRGLGDEGQSGRSPMQRHVAIELTSAPCDVGDVCTPVDELVGTMLPTGFRGLELGLETPSDSTIAATWGRGRMVTDRGAVAAASTRSVRFVAETRT